MTDVEVHELCELLKDCCFLSISPFALLFSLELNIDMGYSLINFAVERL